MVIKNLRLTKKTERAVDFFEDKIAFTISPIELKTLIDNGEDIKIIDVRKREHYLKSHIPTAISFPEDDIGLHVNRFSKNTLNVVYCYTETCHLADQAALVLAENDCPVRVLDGGFLTWRDKYEFDIVS